SGDWRAWEVCELERTRVGFQVTHPHLPRLRVDPATLPPLLSTGDPHSFARFTLDTRDPRILEDLEAAPWFSPDLKNALKKFRQGVIKPLGEDAPDIKF